MTNARPVADQTDRIRNPGPGTYSIKAEIFKGGNNTVIGRERGREKVD